VASLVVSKFEGWKGRHFYGRPLASLGLTTLLGHCLIELLDNLLLLFFSKYVKMTCCFVDSTLQIKNKYTSNLSFNLMSFRYCYCYDAKANQHVRCVLNLATVPVDVAYKKRIVNIAQKMNLKIQNLVSHANV